MSRSISGGSSSSPGAVARRTPHDDLADDEDGFAIGMAESDDVVYRRAEVAQPHLSPGLFMRALRDLQCCFTRGVVLCTFLCLGGPRGQEAEAPCSSDVKPDCVRLLVSTR